MSAKLLAAQHSAAFFVLGLLQGAGIKVRFGKGPMHDPTTNTIWFPNYVTLVDPSKDEKLQQQLLYIYQCMALHEHEHPLFTTEDRNKGKVPWSLWMALEDVRVDILGQSRYPGGKLIFERGYGALIDTGRYWVPLSPDSGLVSVVCGWTLYRARHEIAEQQCFGALAAGANAILTEMVGEDAVQEGWSIVCRTRHARASIDVVKIVDDLLVWLKSLLDQQQDQQSGSSGSSDSKPNPDDAAQPDQSGDSSSSGNPSGEDESETGDAAPQAADSTGDDPTPEGEDASGSQASGASQEDSADAPADGSPQPGESDAPPSPTQQGADDADISASAAGGSKQPEGEDDGAQPGNPGSGAQATSGEDANDPTTDSATDGSGTRPLGQDELDAIDDCAGDLPKDVGAAISDAFSDASGAAAAMGATEVHIPEVAPAMASQRVYGGDLDTRPMSIKLSRLLHAQSRSVVSYERRGSRVDPRRLRRVPLGEREVFVEEATTIQVDTACMVVIDRSPSMLGARIAVARAAALRACLALQGVRGVALSAMAFPDDVKQRDVFDDVRSLVPFDRPVRSYAQAFLDLDAAGYDTTAGTPLHVALTQARYELLRRREPRRICLVVTDGEPDGGADFVRPYVDLLTGDRIEAIGLGVMTDAVKKLFPRSAVIQNLSELEPALLDLLQSSLLSKLAA